jgi:hypothetical protein
MEHRTYLCLYLVLDYLKNNLVRHSTRAKVQQFIRHLPPTVEHEYENMLNSSPDPEAITRLLSIIIAAQRPLTIGELKMALELTYNVYEELDEMDTETDSIFKDTLKDLCGLMLVVHDSKVYFLHDTARTFLLRETLRGDDASLFWKESIRFSSANSSLAEACIVFLSVRDFEQFPVELNNIRNSRIGLRIMAFSYMQRHLGLCITVTARKISMTASLQRFGRV